MTGKRPSGSAPERVNSSVWHTPLALISTRTSPSLGPARSTVTISSGLPAAYAIAAFAFMVDPTSKISIGSLPRAANVPRTITRRNSNAVRIRPSGSYASHSIAEQLNLGHWSAPVTSAPLIDPSSSEELRRSAEPDCRAARRAVRRQPQAGAAEIGVRVVTGKIYAVGKPLIQGCASRGIAQRAGGPQ